jgi:hypothetical protein
VVLNMSEKMFCIIGVHTTSKGILCCNTNIQNIDSFFVLILSTVDVQPTFAFLGIFYVLM